MGVVGATPVVGTATNWAGALTAPAGPPAIARAPTDSVSAIPKAAARPVDL